MKLGTLQVHKIINIKKSVIVKNGSHFLAVGNLLATCH